MFVVQVYSYRSSYILGILKNFILCFSFIVCHFYVFSIRIFLVDVIISLFFFITPEIHIDNLYKPLSHSPLTLILQISPLTCLSSQKIFVYLKLYVNLTIGNNEKNIQRLYNCAICITVKNKSIQRIYQFTLLASAHIQLYYLNIS